MIEWNFNFPSFKPGQEVCIDVETRDPDLLSMGPSDIRGGGYTVGYCVGYHDGNDYIGHYLPIRHPDSFNYPEEKVLSWLKEQLEKGITVVNHNIGGYDQHWMATDGLFIQGDIIDTQSAEALINENASSFALNTLAKKYLGETKTEEELYEFCANNFGGRATRAQGNNFWRVPSEIMKSYGEGDAVLPLKVWKIQRKLLEKDDLMDLFKMEMDLLPLLREMRARGVRVDLGKARDLKIEMQVKQDRAQAEIDELAGKQVNTNQATHLVELFEKLKIPIKETEKGNPSFNKETLATIDHPVADLITKVKQLEKFRGTFLEGFIEKYEVKGRLHSMFHPLRKGDGGTVTGRFSSSNGNLQNLPARDGEYGPLIRSLFIPDEGHVWTGIDYSSVEVRVFMHYAKGSQADRARAEFHENPEVDYHQMIADMTGLPRQQAKTINFGLIH